MPAFNYTNNEGRKNLSVIFDDGEVFTATGDNPVFKEILELVTTGDMNDPEVVDDLRAKFNPGKAIEQKLHALSADVSVVGNSVLYNGAELRSVLSDKIVALFYDNENYAPFVKFLEKFMANPNSGSVEQAYSWIEAEFLSLTKDGDIVGYKAVTEDLKSTRSGPNVIVNGQAWSESKPVDNSPGNVVEMSRDHVAFDPGSYCSAGLHVGTFAYASSFAGPTGKVVKVVVDPRHIVSVPNDHSGAKMRVCRYEVVEVIDSKVDTHYDESAQYTRPQVEVATTDGPDWKVIGTTDTGGMVYGSNPSDLMTYNKTVDTRQNHLTQKRGPDGRFVKKNK